MSNLKTKCRLKLISKDKIHINSIWQYHMGFVLALYFIGCYPNTYLKGIYYFYFIIQQFLNAYSSPFT